MKKKLTFIPLILAIIFLVLAVSECFYIVAESERLSNTPGSSGVDYLVVLFSQGLVCLYSGIGWILSVVSMHIVKNKIWRYLSIALIFGTPWPMLFVLFS